MRIFKTKWFHRFTQKHRISDDDLLNAIQQIEQGLIDASLGANLYKQRIGKQGQGKSSGYRSIIVYQITKYVFFILAFEKSDKENLTQAELAALKQSADSYLTLTEHQIETMLQRKSLVEITKGNQE